MSALPLLTSDPVATPPRPPSPVHSFGTLAVHAGSPHDPTTGAVIEPISLSTTFAQTAVGQPIGEYEYSRSANPNRTNFEAAVAALEHAKYALAFSSGSATTANILQSLASGSHVISVSDVYGGTHRYFTQVAKAHGVKVTFTPEIEVDISEHITDETRLIWIESPSNPTLRLVDIRAVVSEAHKRGVLVVVDNTFLSPYVQNPLDLGADIVVHSVTKYINGHSDVVMGKQHRNGMGGGMLSFRIQGGHAAAERFCQFTKIFTLAESLGGVESLVEVPSSMTHAGIPKDQREAVGVFDDLVRISCGVEDAVDLRNDVLQALEKAVSASKNGVNGVNGNGVNGQ
ncbi:Cystathionine gamma-lyase [Ilyonectria robusta]